MTSTGDRLLGSTSPKYVARSVHVSMVFVTAGETPKTQLASPITRFHVPTFCARLTRVARINCHDYPTGALSLVQEH
jgi:hypothetical protein